MGIRVIRPGLLTTVQDVGRFGYQRYGVAVSGAMDCLSLRVANLLVGNHEQDAVCEITLRGPSLLFEEAAVISICGADLSARIGEQPVLGWRPIAVYRGSILEFGESRQGCRAYLAIAGGIEVPLVMGSRSTFLRAKIGGLEGRAVEAGDVLKINSRPTAKQEQSDDAHGSCSIEATNWCVSQLLVPSGNVVRVMRGDQFDRFTAESQDRFFAADFQVTAQSDRMGYRLAGPKLHLSDPRELVSEAVVAGTVQVPADGQPIILMADHPTTGGYPRIAQVATIDLPILAQMKPGERIRFQEIALEEAQDLHRQCQRTLIKLKCAVALKGAMGCCKSI
jgi:antagonist of KipI